MDKRAREGASERGGKCAREYMYCVSSRHHTRVPRILLKQTKSHTTHAHLMCDPYCASLSHMYTVGTNREDSESTHVLHPHIHTPTPSQASQPSHPSHPSHPSQSHTPSSGHPATSAITPWQPPLPRKVMPSSQDEEAGMFFQDLKLSWNGQGPLPSP